MSCTAQCTRTLFSLLVDWKRHLTAGREGTIVFETISFHPLTKHHQTFAEHLNSSKAPCSHWTSQFIIYTVCCSCLRAVTAHGPRWSAGLVTTFAFMWYAGWRSGRILIEDASTGDSVLHLLHFKYELMVSRPINTGGGCGFVKLLGKCREWNSGHWETPVVVQGTRGGESTINLQFCPAVV